MRTPLSLPDSLPCLMSRFSILSLDDLSPSDRYLSCLQQAVRLLNSGNSSSLALPLPTIFMIVLLHTYTHRMASLGRRSSSLADASGRSRRQALPLGHPHAAK